MSRAIDMTPVKSASASPEKRAFENRVWIPRGTFIMGSDKHYREEAPLRQPLAAVPHQER
jgi:cystathionine beta-lyase family protein involved in aluminum resistance